MSKCAPPEDYPPYGSCSEMCVVLLVLLSSSSSNGSVSYFGLLTQRTMILLRRSFLQRSLYFTLLVVDIEYGRALVGRVSLELKVSLCHRGCRRLFYDQVCVFPAEGFV